MADELIIESIDQMEKQYTKLEGKYVENNSIQNRADDTLSNHYSLWKKEEDIWKRKQENTY